MSEARLSEEPLEETARSVRTVEASLGVSGSVCLEALYAGARVVSFFKPMAAWIKHWHIVNSKEEMVERILEILNDPDIDYRPVLPYSVSDSARAVMKLFDYDEKAV